MQKNMLLYGSEIIVMKPITLNANRKTIFKKGKKERETVYKRKERETDRRKEREVKSLKEATTGPYPTRLSAAFMLPLVLVG